MKTYDLVIIGSGPSGFSSSFTALKENLDVIILEKEKLPRDKYCGGGVTPGSIKMLEKLGVKNEIEEDVERYVRGGAIVSPRGSIAVIEFKGEAWVVNRALFDMKLIELSVSEGAELKEKWKATSIAFKPDHVEVMNNKGEKISARYLIDASGTTNFTLNRIDKNEIYKREFIHAWGDDSFSHGSKLIVKWWKRELGMVPLIFSVSGEWGYLWIFPKRETLNIGFGTLLTNSKLHVKKLNKGITLLRKVGLIPFNLNIKIKRSWLIPVSYKLKLVFPNYRTLLVGDAGGLTNPLTGEGIYGALVSGMLAARTVKGALDSDNSLNLKKYENELYDLIGEDYFEYGIKLAKAFYSSPKVEELAIRAAMSDERLMRLVIEYLLHVRKGVGKQVYEYIKKNLPKLAYKSLLIGKKVKLSLDGAPAGI